MTEREREGRGGSLMCYWGYWWEYKVQIEKEW